jgi:hypothetical protein
MLEKEMLTLKIEVKYEVEDESLGSRREPVVRDMDPGVLRFGQEEV